MYENNIFTKDEVINFKEMTTSLKLAQRAEIELQDKETISSLYVDPLPDEGVLNSVLSDETTYLIGRRGTGKSTIFAVAQERIKNEYADKISIYLDAQTIYGKVQSMETSVDDAFTRRLLLAYYFILEVNKEIINEIDLYLGNKHLLEKVFKFNNGFKKNIEDKLNKVKDRFSDPKFLDASYILLSDKETSKAQREVKNEKVEGNIDLKLSKYRGSFGFENTRDNMVSEHIKDRYSSKLIREFNIVSFMQDIQNILVEIGINKMYIFIDDFSELNEISQQFFVDVLLAPLNNWSNKFFRFKIACYPERMYFGDIDRSKISEEYIDHFELYKGSSNLPSIEERSLQFIDRILYKRFQYFLDDEPKKYFNTINNTWDDIKRELFYATMNIPRVLGYVLENCWKDAILYQKKISIETIKRASQSYYENKVRVFFDKGTKILEPFYNRMDRYGNKKLLDSIVEKAIDRKAELRNNETQLFQGIYNPPTSHYYISRESEKYLNTLELNYFVSKYYEQSDRSGNKITIYCLNHGLCIDQNIDFGRPMGNTIYRKYYISRQFDYNNILTNFLLGYKEYECNKCKKTYEYKDYEVVLQAENVCYKGCREVSEYTEKYLFDDYYKINREKEIGEKQYLSEEEYDVLRVIYMNEGENIYAQMIALELDCTYQMVGQIAKRLDEKKLVVRRKTKDKRRTYVSTEQSKKYFLDLK